MSREHEVFTRLLHELLKESPESMREQVHWFFAGHQPHILARIRHRLGIAAPLKQGFATRWGGLRWQLLDPEWLKPGARVVTDTLEHGVIEALQPLPPESCSTPDAIGYPVLVPCVELRQYPFYSRAKLRRIYQLLSLPIPWSRSRTLFAGSDVDAVSPGVDSQNDAGRVSMGASEDDTHLHPNGFAATPLLEQGGVT